MPLATLREPAIPLLCGLLALYVLRVIMTYAKLMRFRGPAWTGISNWPHSIAMLRGSCHEFYAQANEKYGTRTWQPCLPILTVLNRARPNRPSRPSSAHHLVSGGLDARQQQAWLQALRLTPADSVFGAKYSGRENTDLEFSVDKQLQNLLDLIRAKYVSSCEQAVPMNLAKKVQYFTLDVISSVGLGKAFGMLEADRDVDQYLQSSDEGLAIGNAALALGFSNINQAPFIGKFFAPSPKDNNGFGRLMTTCFRFVDERAASATDKRSDMLASFIRHGLSGEELRTEALEQILAGSDTTAGAIRGTLLHLMTNPRVYVKLQREIDDAVHRGLAPSAGQGLITAAQAKQLPYLQAVIREALRVWPPVSNIFPRDVPKDGDTVVVNGQSIFLPGGVCIGYSAYAMHRSEKIYGKDAKAFRPERWLLEPNPTKLALMVRTNDLIFGHGKFQCLGKPVAQVEIGKMIFELLRNFDLALLNPTHPWDARNNLGLFTISNMWVQVTERTAGLL
ncbi:hypothetical protein AN9296.2 [Aspergillus nidulans FGSC A4]|uniref:Cytochrome P450 monooxygenase ABA1 n=1 Tax=Emericella nidulans (strain FGSC A4 / ATCC 38163 / CBS 112.46 / NRRL 194 / M139) TaxID=227321 RepID=Q5AQY4_EMENI|nr:protein CYP535D1 [Aspergillus nidulans FGSC A4]EAA66363.1 hypothetical protein AN9296.2 [Aspergillus nidulans FGSC A4]CBF87351.1 TPA: cytochrome P450, putative (Eurofung) [Aspergillus nidulans FGSC A4]|eukprot:XP_682565.1 hypothetical protein AN9296.2 [Aspergillus nidulans FGSC A4]